MPITEEQRVKRREYIGSSDMAAVLGVDPFRTAYDVWLDKCGMLEDRAPTEVMKAGTRFEAGVLEYAEEELGALQHDVSMQLQDSHLAANIDAVVVKSGEPVEAKTVGLMWPTQEWWGEAGTDQIPDRVIIQTHVHMLCTEAKVCHTPTFIGGRGFVMFRVPFSDELGEIIRKRAGEFWGRVQQQQPPESLRASLEVVKLVRRQPKKVTDIRPALVQRWLDAKEGLAESKRAKEQAEADVLAAMGDAELANCGDLGELTYLETTRKAYAVKESTYRTLRFKKAR